MIYPQCGLCYNLKTVAAPLKEVCLPRAPSDHIVNESQGHLGNRSEENMPKERCVLQVILLTELLALYKIAFR